MLGPISGGATYGIGSIFTAATQSFGNALLQAGALSVSQGVLGLMQGQNFLSSVIGVMVGTLAAKRRSGDEFVVDKLSNFWIYITQNLTLEQLR